MANYSPIFFQKDNFFVRIFDQFFLKTKSSKIPDSPRGIYLHGSVGCGKTMLMDLFYDCCPLKKKRVHFYDFMNDVHRKIHALKLIGPSRDLGNKRVVFDPISNIADDVIQETHVLCFDEFQRQCLSICLDSNTDYRKASKLADGQLFFVEGICDANSELDVIFKKLASRENDVIRPRKLDVLGRKLVVEKTCGLIADIDFEQVCVQPRGSIDFLVLARSFHTVILRGIPIFGQAQMSELRRFITLVDTFYDQKVRLVCGAADYPQKLFAAQKTDQIMSDDQMRMMDDFSASQNEATAFTGMEEVFAFDRTISRLAEMQSANYWLLREPT